MAVARRKARSILMVIALVAAYLLFPPTANATTDYDNITVSGGSLTISYHGQPWTGVTCSNNVVDLTNSWRAILLDSSRWDIGGSISSGDAADAISDLESAFTSGTGWGVAQVYNTDAGLNSFGSSLSAYGGEQDTWLEVWWNDTGTASFNSVSPFGPTLMADGNVHTAWIYFSNASGHQCEPRVTQHALVSSPAVNAAMAIDFTSYPYMHWAPVFLNFDVTYPSGYEGATVQTNLPHPAYVAMGDSFSSGEGHPPFEMGTDTSYDGCRRSTSAYPYILQSDLSLNGLANVTCSGATVSDVLNGRDGESPQINALSSSTDLVTITVGGNDADFASLVETCFTAPCGPGTSVYSDSIDVITNDLGDRLDTLYRTMLNKADTAEIYVLGYPYITPEDPSDSSCVFLQDSAPFIGTNDAQGGRMIVDTLNTVISSTILSIQGDVSSYDAARLHFVDPTVTGNDFTGHDVCSESPYFVYPLVEIATHNWMHPNSAGHLAYANILEDAIS